MTEKTISTSELKTHCAKVIEDVLQGRQPITITKRGRPVAQLVPLEEEPRSLFGFASGSITIHGDIIEPIDVTWEANE